jgi:4-hydroxy-tetrahydrodipicolinate reductase
MYRVSQIEQRKMNIALLGYGKMGKAIEEIALQKGHQIVLRISDENPDDLTILNIQKADVCIEFSTPETAFSHISTALKAGVPVVCGTTGWLHQLHMASELCMSNQTAFLYASNFSIGVNLFFKINTLVAGIMSKYPEYIVSMEETHHTQKKDAPSGTAITLAEGILGYYPAKKGWVNQATNKESELGIQSFRIDPDPGTHVIHYESDIDRITISHSAHSRKGFASGALMAAEFLVGKKGVFSMDDVLHIE